MKSSRDLKPEVWHRVLLLGMPGVGKSTAAIATSPAPVAVILCEEEDAMQYPKAASPYEFSFARVTGWGSTQRAFVEIQEAIKNEGIQTVVVDPVTDLGKILEREAVPPPQKGVDTYAAYRTYADRMMNVLDNLFRLPAHVIACAHYLEKDGKMLPLFSGQMAIQVMKRFTDRVWMDLRGEERVFITGPTPAMSGPACRSSKGTEVLPASIEALFAHFAEMRAEAEKASAGPPVKIGNSIPRIPRGPGTRVNTTQTKK